MFLWTGNCITEAKGFVIQCLVQGQHVNRNGRKWEGLRVTNPGLCKDCATNWSMVAPSIHFTKHWCKTYRWCIWTGQIQKVEFEIPLQSLCTCEGELEVQTWPVLNLKWLRTDQWLLCYLFTDSGLGLSADERLGCSESQYLKVLKLKLLEPCMNNLSTPLPHTFPNAFPVLLFLVSHGPV